VLAYIGRRISILIVILFGSSFILYNLAAISGDPLEGLRGSTDPKVKVEVQALIHQLQLNVPPPARYFIWLKHLLTGDLGLTRSRNPVSTELAQAIPITIRLIFMATVIAVLLGIGLGIVSALRQYSRFDYAMTFVSFLLYSLPIFWVAVLLKQYLAISFNNFLGTATIAPWWIVGFSIVSGFFWAAVISGDRKRVLSIFGIAALATGAVLTFLSLTKWFAHPGLGPIVVAMMGVGVAYGVTFLSTGLGNKAARNAALAVVGLTIIFYFPTQYFFNKFPGPLTVFLLACVAIGLAVGAGYYFAKEDRRPVIRTSVITSIVMGVIVLIDKLMKTWVPYINTDAVNNRPIPTIGESNSLLAPGHFWFSLLDILLHVFLPTIALTLISFAGYVRYSRGTLLEVMNQDYIRTARAKGLTERTVIMRHAFRNTLIPLTTIVVVDFAGIIGGAIITERVFGWQGMGTLFNNAITNFDLTLLMGVFFVTSSLAVLANLVADLLYSYLDPRIRVVSK
jgi:peptide/nickel transport system permease protein